jgi:hypothetical protein
MTKTQEEMPTTDRRPLGFRVKRLVMPFIRLLYGNGKLCKECKYCDEHPSGNFADCIRTKCRDKVNNRAMESCGTERLLSWPAAILTNMCGKTGRFFEHI